jgi:hypothetical protein
MTKRKPPGVGFESWVDRQIREAADRGDFDNLPGAGKPLPGLSDPHEELWWLKSHLRREGLPTETLLPTPLLLRKEIERLPDTVRDLPSEREVRDAVEELNLRIVDWLRSRSGPRVHVGPVNADDVVDQWRAARAAARRTSATGSAEPATTTQALSSRARWWHRIARRHRESG